MRSFCFVLVAALVSTGCALRPRYADFVTEKTAGKEVTFLVTDADTDKPVAGAKVELSELKNRLSVTTAADGTFTLPVEKKYVDENSIFVVTLPKGVTEYRLSLAPPKPLPAPVPPPVIEPAPIEVPAVPASPAMPALPDAPDAGANG